jgi:hypothetical protein
MMFFTMGETWRKQYPVTVRKRGRKRKEGSAVNKMTPCPLCPVSRNVP